MFCKCLNVTSQIKLTLLAAAVLSSAQFHELDAKTSPFNSSNRIAISADGNPDADRDDISATPLTLAVLAKAGLQNNLVHCDFNNWLEYKPIGSNNNNMWVGAMGGQTRWGFNRNKFFDAAYDPNGAINNLKNEINKSTANNPLYIIVAGPMELIYQAMKAANNSARTHVTLVSHHGYNDYYKPRLWQHNLDDVLRLNSNIKRIKIVDQNQTLSTSDYSPWFWLRDHQDANLRWVYQRMQVGPPDVSDAGIATWLIGINSNDEKVTPNELKNYFDNNLVPTNGGSTNAPPAPAGVGPVINLPITESIFQEVGGKIVIEAESVPLTDDWRKESSDAGFSGSGYIHYIPANIHAIHGPPGRGALIYKLRISEAGKYRMALKSSHKGAPARDKWNDCWTLMGIDPAPWGSIRKTYHSINDAQFNSGIGFTYTTTHDNYGVIANQEGHFSVPLYDLSAGDHYFFIVGRSGGYRIDKIHFFKEGVSGFKDDSIPPTPILPGGGSSSGGIIFNPSDDAYLQGTNG